MQTYAEAASQAVAEAENALRVALEQKEPNYAVFEPLLAKLRISSQEYVFLTFATAAAKTTEDHLWDGHVRVNKKFQKHLKHFRDGSGKKKHVERRKAEKHYLNFIKSSQQFYRGYIQRLAAHFSEISELVLISNKLRLDTLPTNSATVQAVTVKPEQKIVLIASCHNALMRLGDLSRYRSTELEYTDRNWGPAKGHYQLALSLKPESGAAYNQLAVMALADEDHLRAVYYLHRAAAAGKPFPVARDNVKLEFDKLLKLEPEEKPAISDTSKQTIEVLENRFLAFHANCHRQPSEFLTFSEKATQILQLVTLGFEEIKDRSLDKLVQKMCLINIAAEHLAWQGTSKENLPSEKTLVTKLDKKNDQKLLDEHQKSSLLKILAREISDIPSDGISTEESPHASVPFSVGRLLPHLRQYSSWLLSNIKALLEPKHPSTQKYLDHFWKIYLNVTNSLLARYAIGGIQAVEHLLEEDEDTLAFAPFTEQVSGWRNNLGSGSRKPAFPSTDLVNNPRLEEQENLARIQRIVYDGATIVTQKKALGLDWAPINLEDATFVLVEKPVKAPEVIKPQTPPQPFRIRAHVHSNSLNGNSPVQSPKPTQHKRPVSIHKNVQNPVVTNNQPLGPETEAMEDMVNNLVNHVPTVPTVDTKAVQATTAAQSITQPPSTYTHSPAFDDSSVLVGTQQPNPTPINIMDIVRNMQQRSTETTPSLLSTQGPNRLNNSSVPGLHNTAFTSTPGTNTLPLSRPGTASEANLSAQPSSSALFQQEIQQREREIQARTSPFIPSELSSWPMPQNLTPKIQGQQHMWNTANSSPWSSPVTRSPNQQQRQLPQNALFGAIGEPRRNGSRTPASGQSG